jgi:hypothetical protein
MRALTLTQPWAGLVASGIKLVENRPRRMIKSDDFGKRFAIHASREIDDPTYDRIKSIDPTLFTAAGYARWYSLSRITSAVIAVATLDRMIEVGPASPDFGDPNSQAILSLPEDQRRWFFGPIGYVLRDVIALETPVPCRGFQGFWTLPADVAAKVGEQVCDECRGPGVYFLNGEPQTCICMEPQT